MINYSLLVKPSRSDVAVIANFIFNEWTQKEDNWSYEQTKQFVKDCCQKDRIPFTVVARNENNNIIGACQVVMQDNIVKPDLYPWVTNLWVAPEYRKKGIARRLLLEVTQYAIKYGIERLYLYTECDYFYDKLGWDYLGPIDTYRLEPRKQKLYCVEI